MKVQKFAATVTTLSAMLLGQVAVAADQDPVANILGGLKAAIQRQGNGQQPAQPATNQSPPTGGVANAQSPQAPTNAASAAGSAQGQTGEKKTASTAGSAQGQTGGKKKQKGANNPNKCSRANNYCGTY